MLRRLRFFGIGFLISIMAVGFFWSKKKVQFDYGMDARTLKSITYRKKIYSDEIQQLITEKNIDSVMNSILMRGDVNFGKSKQHEKPAKYWVESTYKAKKVVFWVVRNDSTATIELTAKE